MCKGTDEQIGKIFREALSEVVDVMAEEAQLKALGLPRYEKRMVSSPTLADGFDLRYGVYCLKPSRHPVTNATITVSSIVGVFKEEYVCDLAVKLLNDNRLKISYLNLQ